jgi:hypothetical protein
MVDDIEHLDDMLREPRLLRRLRLTDEASDQARTIEKVYVEYLERDCSVSFEISRLPNRCHAACTDLAIELISLVEHVSGIHRGMSM